MEWKLAKSEEFEKMAQEEEFILTDDLILIYESEEFTKVKDVLAKNFNIEHTNIQIETKETDCKNCCL